MAKRAKTERAVLVDGLLCLHAGCGRPWVPQWIVRGLFKARGLAAQLDCRGAGLLLTPDAPRDEQLLVLRRGDLVKLQDMQTYTAKQILSGAAEELERIKGCGGDGNA